MIVDDHPAVREGIKVMLDLTRRAHLLVGDHASFADALAQIAHVRPSLIIADVRIPGMAPLDFLARALRLAPDVRVLFMSAFCERETVSRLLRAGAAGFMTKSTALGEFTEAINAISDDRLWVSDDMLDLLLHESGQRRAHAL